MWGIQTFPLGHCGTTPERVGVCQRSLERPNLGARTTHKFTVLPKTNITNYCEEKNLLPPFKFNCILIHFVHYMYIVYTEDCIEKYSVG